MSKNRRENRRPKKSYDDRGKCNLGFNGVFIPWTCYFFFNSVLRPFQDYFSSYETGQSVGGAKTGEPREKTPDTPASRTWLFLHTSFIKIEKFRYFSTGR